MMINPKYDNKNARRLPTELLGSAILPASDSGVMEGSFFRNCFNFLHFFYKSMIWNIPKYSFDVSKC